MVSVVSLQSVLVLIGLLTVVNLVVLALAIGHRRRIAAAEEALEEQVQTMAGTLEAGLAEEIGRIEGTISSLPDHVEDVQEDVTMLSERLPEVERALARLDGRLDGFSEGGLTTIEDRLETVQSDLAGIEDDLRSVDTAVADAGDTLAAVEDVLATLDREIDQLLEEMPTEAGTAIADDAAAIQRRLAAIEDLLRDEPRDRNRDPSEDSDEDMGSWISGADADTEADDGTAGEPDRVGTTSTAAEEELWVDTDDESDGGSGASTDAGSDPTEESAGPGGFELPDHDDDMSESDEGDGESR